MSIDRSPQAPNATSPVAPMSPSAQRAASPSDDGRSSNASRAPSSQDPYYSNEDIAALHSVVVTAQELLDTAPEPKPLPAAALFKAYDQVLPTYGIDPDTDHHLSTFVFRVGGERGGGTLLDKFQSILGRMGIVLEFGDNTTASSRTSPSASPAYSSTSRQSHGLAREKKGNLTSGGVAVSRPSVVPLVQSSSTSPESQPPQQNHVDFSDTDEEDGEYEEMRRAVLSSAMNRWRSLVANRRTQQAQRIPSFPSIPEEASADVRNFEDRPFQDRPAITVSEASTIPHINGVKSDGQVSDKGTTDVNVQPISPQSPIRPRPTIIDAIRPLTASTQQSQSDAVVAHHEDDAPSSPKEQPPAHPQEVEEEPSRHSVAPSVPDVHIPPVPEVRIAPTVTQLDVTQRDEKTKSRPSTPQEPTDNNTTLKQHSVQESERGPSTPAQQPDPEKEYQRLLRRASRAREIYLASKVFNHWADRTARRLERDAVARRHMIRFRYFRSWCQAPVVREPTVDQMRAAVVVKKWQRIVAQEKTLDAMAKAAARAYQLKKIQQVLDRWSCLRLEHVGRQITASHSRTKAISRWMLQASNGVALDEAIKSQVGLQQQLNTIHKWQGYAEREAILTDSARRMGSVHQSFTHLKEWWDQAEIGRRAATYRQYLLMKKVDFAFDQWNLQARAQAFIWRREYLQVARVFDRWCQRAEQDGDMSRRAESYYETQAKSRVLGCFRRFDQESSYMTLLENRARLYLGATSLLRVFDRTVKRRQDRDKQYVKRYLMARYTQVSSAKKKRNFFTALDRWRALAAEDREQGEKALELHSRKQSHRRMLVAEAWAKQAAIDEKRLQDARLEHAQGWLDAWKEHAEDLEQRDVEAWQLWAADKQRQSLKSWSIASLQQSGQAHTAIEVRKKHERERRNRILQHWRQRDDRLENMPSGFGSQPNSVVRSLNWSRASWRGFSGRRSTLHRNDRPYDYSNTPLETPTRWTGHPLSMSTILPPGSMAPLREADENDAVSSFAGDDDDLDPASPSLRPASRGQFSTMPSTTPMAPVPSHLVEHGLRDEYEEPEQNGINRSTKASSRIHKFESPRPRPQDSRPTGMSEPANADRVGPPQRSQATTRSFGFRQPNRRTIGPRPASPEVTTQAIASKSVGARSTGLRFGVSRNAGITPSARSVRIQSPRTFSIATPRPGGAPRSARLRSGTAMN
ncbi:hypothetical protein CDV36_009239 [Fusarium kuroshium]|uniref:Sfi1 spindle body domain-containing protein n=1 Tax=Fusarium kuroshium TaxID=2010991 RepID=A0A3M2S0P4_9HYPO|nr:hypothetical protein CDV36_009239 [Fusarium kuroshium]